MQKYKILIVDSDRKILKTLCQDLEKSGFDVITVSNGKVALELISVENPDLILMDLIIPGVSGLEMCKILRKQDNTAHIPIIVITAKSDEDDKIQAFRVGIDDYVIKPFSHNELIARIIAVLRRSKSTGMAKSVIETGNILIDTEKHKISIDGELRNFTPKEFYLLKLFVTNPGKVFSRKYLLETIWGYDYLGDTRTVDVHIHYLRKKIGDTPGRPELIETIRGIGYRFNKQE